MTARILILIIFFISSSSYGDSSLLPEDDFYSLNSYGEYFLDDTGKVGIGHLLQDKSNFNFQEIKVENLNFGITPSHLWLYFPLRGSKKEDLVKILEVQPPFTDNVELYHVVGKKIISEKKSGDWHKGSERYLTNRNILFEVQLPRLEKSEIYLKISSKNYLLASVYLWETHKKFSSIAAEDATVYIFYGLIFIMIVYNFFFFFAFRDISFFYFIFYSISAGLTQMCIDGTISLISDNPYLNNHLHILSTLLVVCFGILFFIRFLKINEFFPFWSKALRIFLLLNLILCVYVWFGDISTTDNLANLSALFVNIFAMPLSIAMIKKKYSPAWYYFFGYLFVLASFILYMLKIYNIYPNITINIMKYGFGFEMCLFSLGLSERIGIIRSEKEVANKQIIEMQMFAKVKLEKEVIERTRELNGILGEIKRDLSVAKKIQENLLSEKFFETKKLIIDSHYIPFNEIGGDIYDIHKFSENKFRIFLADATGHGIQAALFTMLIIGEYEVRKVETITPSEVLKKLNEKFTTTYDGLNAFFTACVIDIDTENDFLSFASAGHPLQILFTQKNKKLKGLSSRGKMIGLSRESEYQNENVSFSKGDKILLFTDGVFEEFNSIGKQFGEFQLYKLFKKFALSISSPKNLITEIISKLNFHMGGKKFQDDVTILYVEYKN